MSPRFEVELDQESYLPGETVNGSVLVTEGGGSRGLEAVLEYKEEVDDYLEVATSISSGALHSGDLTTGSSFEFELPLPGNALPNYRSEHGELYWELDVRSDESGIDTHERRRIEVRPSESGLDTGPTILEPEPSGAEPAPVVADQGRRGGLISSTGLGSKRGQGSDLVRWVVRLFFAVGVVALLVSAGVLVWTIQFVARAERATGTVTEVVRETDSEGDDVFYPVVRFTTPEGAEIEFKSSSGSAPASHSEGDQVDVLYDPDDPDDARLSGFFDLWLFPIVGLALGAGFIAVSLFVRRQTSSEA